MLSRAEYGLGDAREHVFHQVVTPDEECLQGLAIHVPRGSSEGRAESPFSWASLLPPSLDEPPTEVVRHAFARFGGLDVVVLRKDGEDLVQLHRGLPS